MTTANYMKINDVPVACSQHLPRLSQILGQLFHVNMPFSCYTFRSDLTATIQKLKINLISFNNPLAIRENNNLCA